MWINILRIIETFLHAFYSYTPDFKDLVFHISSTSLSRPAIFQVLPHHVWLVAITVESTTPDHWAQNLRSLWIFSLLHPIQSVAKSYLSFFPLFVPCVSFFSFFKFLFIYVCMMYVCIYLFILYLFIYLWLCWVFVSVRGLSLVAASGGHSSSQCAGLSLSRPLLLRGTGSRRVGSATVAHGPSRSAACGIFPDQGSNPCPLHWQADSQPLHHQGSPMCFLLVATPSSLVQASSLCASSIWTWQ